MNEDTEAGALPEGEALPASLPPPLPRHIDPRAVEAVERWYTKHFHAAAVAGRAPITAEDKASLIAHVSAAINPKE